MKRKATEEDFYLGAWLSNILQDESMPFEMKQCILKWMGTFQDDELTDLWHKSMQELTDVIDKLKGSDKYH